MSNRGNWFEIGFLVGFAITLIFMFGVTGLIVMHNDKLWVKELVRRGVMQYDSKTGELKYVTPQDCTQVAK